MAPNQRPFYIALGVVVVGGAAFIASRVIGGSGSLSIPANVPVTATDTAGFRGYVTGSPTAPVEVTEYGDFQCPVCASWEAMQFADIKGRLIDAGKIRFRFRDYPIDGAHAHTRVGSHAMACANDQQHFWDVMPVIFARQEEWGGVGLIGQQASTNPMPALTDIMKKAGVDVPAWTACMESKKYAGRIQASQDEGTALGVNGTPTFLIAGKLYDNRFGGDQMVKVVDSLIAAGSASAKPAGTTKPTGGQ